MQITSIYEWLGYVLEKDHAITKRRLFVDINMCQFQLNEVDIKVRIIDSEPVYSIGSMVFGTCADMLDHLKLLRELR